MITHQIGAAAKGAENAILPKRLVHVVISNHNIAGYGSQQVQGHVHLCYNVRVLTE